MNAILAVIFLCMLLLIGNAGAGVPEEPEAMAVYFSERALRFDFDEAVDCRHPKDLAHFKELCVEFARLAEQERSPLLFAVFPWAPSAKEIEALEAKEVWRESLKEQVAQFPP